jgi:two-component system response regulator
MLPAILLVEDNPDDEFLALRALKQAKIANEILIARDGQEALDCIFQGHPPPNLVLLDLKLPKIDGLEVLRQVRTHPDTRLLPVVVLTSSNEEQDILGSYSNGANSYVRKPIDFDQFSEAVRHLGLYWAVINQPPPSSR